MEGKVVDVDVLIVGAGPTGLLLANDLARRDIKDIKIIDGSEGPSDRTKALVVQIRTLELYDDLGLVDEALEKGMLVKGLAGYLGKGRELNVEFKNLPGKYPGMLTFPQYQNEDVLIRNLKAHGCNVQYGTRMIGFEKHPDFIQAEIQDTKTMETTVIKTKYLVGCDGSHSMVRKTLQLPFEGKKYDDEYLLCDCELEMHEKSSKYLREGEAFLYNDKRLVILFPYKDGTYRIILTRTKGDAGKEVTLKEVQEACDLFPIKVLLKNPKWITAFNLHARTVNQYGDLDRVFLAGDAAHIHSPAGGQGMNTGLQDSYNLGWKLALAIKKAAGKKLLLSYNEERHPIGAALIKTTDKMFSTFAGSGRALQIVKGVIFSWIGRATIVPLMASIAPKWASQLGINYRQSSLSVSNLPMKLVGSWPLLAGDRFPYFQFENMSTFDFLRGTHFSLMFVSTSKDEMKKTLDSLQNVQLHIKVVLVISCNDETEQWQEFAALHNAEVVLLLEKDKAAFEKVFGKIGTVLVRPDGYVGYIEAVGRESKLKAYMEGILE